MRGHLVLLLDGVMEMCWILSHMVLVMVIAKIFKNNGRPQLLLSTGLWDDGSVLAVKVFALFCSQICDN